MNFGVIVECCELVGKFYNVFEFVVEVVKVVVELVLIDNMCLVGDVSVFIVE